MSARPLSLLFVCTGNICRSPYAAALAARLLPDARVASAGTHAVRDGHVPDELVGIAGEAGLDLGPHRGRQLTARHVDEADLVVGLTRAHRSAAIRLLPRASRYSFSLLEFSRLAAGLDTRSAPAGPARIAAVAARRGLAEPAARVADDDVADPMGRGAAAHLAATRQIAPAIHLLASVLGASSLTTSHQNGRLA